jgi:hypothetical protein
MEPEVSNITASSIVFTLFLGFLLLGLPRKYAVVPLLVSGCYMTLGQALIIGGLHFYLIRIIIFFGLLRIFVRKEIFSIKLNSIDKVLIVWLMVNSFVFVLFSGKYVTLTERLGGVYNTLGIYFLVRALIRDFDDIVLTVKMLGIIIIPLAVPFIVEYTTRKNPFSVLGGVPLLSEIRNGRIRCQGPFQHSILAGTFGATALPLFVGLWAQTSRNRLLATAAILAATIIVLTSASSGPLLAYLVSVIGLLFWYFRSQMKAIRRGIVVLLVALHIYMKAPIWFLISRLSDITGGGGWYRSALIDAAISHLDEWWLIGTDYTAHWMPTGLALDPNMTDIVNQFIAQGVNGGLLSMGLFIWMIVQCFKATGAAVRNEIMFSSHERFMIWCLGCTILGHVASFFSVSYFDQITIYWYLIIAMIASLLQSGRVKQALMNISSGNYAFT